MTREPEDPQESPRDNDVGYGRPPKAHQFKPGQSGNPRGRPKGAPTLVDLFAREARSLVKLKRGGEVSHMTKLEVLVRRLFQKAMEGDLAAARLVLLLMGQSGETGEQDTTESVEMPDDEAVQRILVRFAHLLPEGEDEE